MTGREDDRPLDAATIEAAFAPFVGTARILVAVSGGADSTALLGTLAGWCAAPGRPALAAATVDHGIRADSRAEAEAVASFCRMLGIPHAILTWRRDEGRTGDQYHSGPHAEDPFELAPPRHPESLAERSNFPRPHAEVLAAGQPRSMQDRGASFEAPLCGAPQSPAGHSESSQPRHAEEARHAPSRSTRNAGACFETRPPGAPQHDEGGDSYFRPASQDEEVGDLRSGSLDEEGGSFRQGSQDKEGRGVRVSQKAARRARYNLLAAHAARIGAEDLATAHHRDDQAETVLMRLAAGSGPAGLAGMRPIVQRGPFRHVRPFLHLSKVRLVATCREAGWPYAEDPSNADPAYARSRWRALGSRLAREGLDAARLGVLAARMARAEAALEEAAEAAFGASHRPAPDGTVALDGAALAGLPDEIALRVLARAVAAVPLAADGPTKPLRLDRLESTLALLLAAHRAGRRDRRTLAGRLLALGPDGALTITPEPPRRRGMTGR